MTGGTENPNIVGESWVPDLTEFDLHQLGALPDTALEAARKALLTQVDRPFATVAGSEGS